MACTPANYFIFVDDELRGGLDPASIDPPLQTTAYLSERIRLPKDLAKFIGEGQHARPNTVMLSSFDNGVRPAFRPKPRNLRVGLCQEVETS